MAPRSIPHQLMTGTILPSGEASEQATQDTEVDPDGLCAKAAGIVQMHGGNKGMMALKSDLGSVSEQRFQKVVDCLKEKGIIRQGAEVEQD